MTPWSRHPAPVGHVVCGGHPRMPAIVADGSEKLAAVADWREAGVFDDAERTVLALADAICDGEVPASLAHEIEQRFGSRGLVELAVTASAYVMVPRVLSALGVEIESAEAS